MFKQLISGRALSKALCIHAFGARCAKVRKDLRSRPRTQRATRPWDVLMRPQGCAAPMTPTEERQKSSAQLALRWLWQRLEQSLIARSSQLLRLGTAILRKRRCTEQLAQLAELAQRARKSDYAAVCAF